MARRQLAERNEGGITVQLVWNDSAPPGSDVLIEYSDPRTGVFYVRCPPRDRALEAFYHRSALSGTAVENILAPADA